MVAVVEAASAVIATYVSQGSICPFIAAALLRAFRLWEELIGQLPASAAAFSSSSEALISRVAGAAAAISSAEELVSFKVAAAAGVAAAPSVMASLVA